MSSNTVIMKGEVTRGEGKANAAITPGQLIEWISSGNLQRHSVAGSNAQRMFALEDELQGNELTVDYATNSIVQYGVFHPGAEVWSLLSDGEAAVIGSFLESNGDGDLRVYLASSAGAVEYPASIVGIARETLDLSGSSGADPTSRRIRVEVI